MATSEDELAPFALKNVQGLDAGERKGLGAYGAVCEVTLNGLPCIAKRLHFMDLKVLAREKVCIQEKPRRNECVLHTANQQSPQVHEVTVYHPGIMQIQKRREAIAKMGDILENRLYQALVICMQDSTKQRPISHELMKKMCTSYPQSVTESSSDGGKVCAVTSTMS